MARRDNWTYWNGGLSDESVALQEINQIMTDTGLDRAEIDRLILIEWAKARRGQTSSMWGVTFSSVTPGQTPPLARVEEPVKPVEKSVEQVPVIKKHRNSAAAASAIDLDL